ncbi:uncharacterized protein [Miscanthus floridulus]|uniref:uncharacterized protein n=1 Tax=Miscanthus floridulus TaxID=154761 RepID=UPI0034597487
MASGDQPPTTSMEPERCELDPNDEEMKKDVESEASMEPIGNSQIDAEDGDKENVSINTDIEKLPIKDDGEIILNLEPHDDRKRKRADKDEISNRDVEEVRIKEEEQIKDDVLEIVNIKKDEARKHADEDVIAIPQYNKHKKANNAKVLPQDYECTEEDVKVIHYMKGKKEKSLLVRIDDAWVIRDDMDCLLNGDVQVNGALSILTLLLH